MEDFTDRTKICDKKFKELFGTDRGTHPTDPEFMDILQKFIFGEVSKVGSLDNKIRELITVTVLSVMQTLPQLKAHVQACLNVGLSPVEIRETVYQVAPFIGFPKTLNAINTMNEVFTQNGISLPLPPQGTVTDGTRTEKGAELQTPLYGAEIKNKYKNLPDFAAIAIPDFLTELAFGDFYTRNGLEIRTRELLIVCVLAALGTVSPLKAHVAANIKLGNGKETIYAALIQCLPYIGFPAVFAAINEIER